MANYGDSHTNFNDTPLVAGGLGAGLAIGGALIQGVMNFRQQVANDRRRARVDALRRRAVVDRANAAVLGLRLNMEVDKNRTQALVIEAFRRENERLRGR